MLILAITAKLYLPYAHSLKEKRMPVKSITARLRNTFAVSVVETGCQDLHQSAQLGIAAIVSDRAAGDSMQEQISRFLYAHWEGEVTDIETEYR